jgi:hypothetical protein
MKDFTKGRVSSTKRTTVRDVETLPCQGGGLHRLTNAGEVTFCSGCGRGWGELDAAERGR